MNTNSDKENVSSDLDKEVVINELNENIDENNKLINIEEGNLKDIVEIRTKDWVNNTTPIKNLLDETNLFINELDLENEEVVFDSLAKIDIEDSGSVKRITRSSKNKELKVLQFDKKRRNKKMAVSKKLNLEGILNLIPKCAKQEDIQSFVTACDVAISLTDTDELPIVIKLITTKITDEVQNIIKYRDVSTWDNIKKYLLESSISEISEPDLQLRLLSMKMRPNEDVNTFAKRLEDLYFKLCRNIKNSMSDAEAIGAKEQLLRQTLATFIKGLVEPIKTHVKSRNPDNLETAKIIARTEEIEIQSENDTRKHFNNNNNENRFRTNNHNNFIRHNNGYRAFNHTNNNANFRRYYPNNLNNSNNGINNRFRGNNNTNYQNRNNTRPNYNQLNNRQSGSQTKCYNCGGNHFARDCRSGIQNNYNNARNQVRGRPPNNNNNMRSNIQCLNCKKYGHYARDCYSRNSGGQQTNNVTNENTTGNGSTELARGQATVSQITANIPDLSLL